jgi:hypothetical protein
VKQEEDVAASQRVDRHVNVLAEIPRKELTLYCSLSNSASTSSVFALYGKSPTDAHSMIRL